MAIDKIRIFPSIGIARLGNSPEFFIGPEIPGRRDRPAGGYKDNRCRVKRQAARFRLFAYDGNTLVQEITSADATITWTAELANTKAAWKRFIGSTQSPTDRNSGVSRDSLKIIPGEQSIPGPDQAAGFNTGEFLGKTVPLGEMQTDGNGRLLILGGFGRSGSVPPGEPIPDFANNDKWHDDVSDGPIKASVVLNGTATPIDAEKAWVICGPPDFAPPVDSVTSLYDTLFQSALDAGLPGVAEPAVPSFTEHIWPVLQRVFDMVRVTGPAGFGHSDFDGTNAAGMSASRRQQVFDALRNPNNLSSGGAMPKLFDDSGSTQLAITKTQYSILNKWTGAAGVDWINDWPGSPPAPPTVVDLTKPEDLSRAALEACVGAAFFPGIEASWMLRDIYAFSEPFRLDHTGRAAGDVTKQMAVPWQADFMDCRKSGNYAWWPAQRPDDVFEEGKTTSVSWTRDLAADHEDMVSNWHKLGFVVEKDGALVETERRIVCRSVTLVTDRSHVSEDEVAGLLTTGSPAVFDNSIYVFVEGFLPAELGITTATPTDAQLASIAPGMAIRRANGTSVPGMSAAPHALLVQDSSLPANLRQRFTFVYSLDFANANDFSVGGVVQESQILTVTATKNAGAAGTFADSGILTLINQPNPYMFDGATHWLSTDVRVFQMRQGETRFGQVMGSSAAAASSFIANVLNNFNAAAQASHPFDSISVDQQTSKLELSRSVNGNRVFNFAIARVRYRGNVLNADNVRVFFRMFRTAATGLDYNKNSTYRRSAGAAPISLLGLQGGNVVTIPFYGDPRIDTTVNPQSTQTDSLNVRTLTPAGANVSHGYFGCWLDFNQTTARFPEEPSPVDGPWTAGLNSIQQLVRGLHQCLTAEIHFAGDPIPTGAAPASNDNLSQRNLAIVESDNPGEAATRTVQHTFEIKASHRLPQMAALVSPPDDDDGDDVSLARASLPPPGPDELMIQWNDLPRDTEMTLYMPDVDANDVLRYAGQNYEALRLEKIDAHTLRCLPGDITFVPLPFGRNRNIAALLTLRLPEGIRIKQVFNVVVRQLSGRPRRVLGAFQLTVPVSAKSVLLEGEIRNLSVLRHIAEAIPHDDQWRPVFERYIGQIGDRVDGFGGNSDAVEPSPDGTGVSLTSMCRRLGWIATSLLTVLILTAAIYPLPNNIAVLALLAAVVAAYAIWIRRCHVSRCGVLRSLILGLGIGAAGTALLTLAGLAAGGPAVLPFAALALGLALAVGAWWRCFR